MRYMGIDYGTKKVGIALSDEQGKYGFAYETVASDSTLKAYIRNLIKEKNIDAIVMGEALDNTGRENEIMKRARIFADALQKETMLPLYFQPEQFSSVEARRVEGSSDKLDASAAAIILQRFLDRQFAEK